MAEGGAGRSMSETETVPIYSSMYSPHSRNHVEGVSVEVCNIMTRLGYVEQIRRKRAEKYREFDMLLNAGAINLTFITVGSKGEGLSFSFESDRDILILPNSALCVEAGVDLRTIPDAIEVYRMDTRVHPGHCRMLLERPATRRFPEMINALCDDGKGNAVLSSSIFLDEYSKYEFSGVPAERAGLSLPRTTTYGMNVDMVWAVRCNCPDILRRWAQRPRLWPPPDVVQKVVSLGSVVTPVGFKGSEYSHVEWRICFNTGETELVNSLNITQANLYVILKMIVKDVLKPNKKEITSFVLKNVIFWQAESNSPALFEERNLIHWLHDALETLRTTIASTQQPYYMIPERNLMAASGLQDEQQRKWVADITDMMAEGPKVILRLPKIRRAIICHPEQLLWFSRRRMELDMLSQECMNRGVQCMDENGKIDFTDIIIQKIVRRMGEIMTEFCLRMIIEGNIVYDSVDILIKRILM